MKLNKNKVYDLSELASEELEEVANYMQNNHGWKGQVPHTDLFWHDVSGTWLYNKHDKVNDMTNAKELFYTLENVQVDCRELTEEQIKEMCEVYESNGYEKWMDEDALKLIDDYTYLRTDWENEFFINGKDYDKTTITYEKFMELFGEPKYEVKYIAEQPSEDKQLQPHYDNTNGSIYKFCNDQKLNSWEFDIIKRVVRCRKKGLFKEDLQKTKDLIDLYLKEFEDEN